MTEAWPGVDVVASADGSYALGDDLLTNASLGLKVEPSPSSVGHDQSRVSWDGSLVKAWPSLWVDP